MPAWRLVFALGLSSGHVDRGCRIATTTINRGLALVQPAAERRWVERLPAARDSHEVRISRRLARSAEREIVLLSDRLPAVAIVEAHDIVELSGARFEHHRVDDRGHPMSCAGREVNRLTGEQLEGFEFAVRASNLEEEMSRLDGDGLLLPLVVLQREGVALDVQSLAAVLAIDDGEVNLMAPRLLDPFDVLHPISLRHDDEARRRGSLIRKASTRGDPYSGVEVIVRSQRALTDTMAGDA